MYYQQLQAESLRLATEIKRLEAEIATYPEGKLICSHNGKYLKWYKSDGHTKKYIPKAKQQLISQLATREYLSCLLADTMQEKKAIDRYLQAHTSYSTKVSSLFSNNPIYHQILSPYISSQYKSTLPDINEWLQASFISNPQHPEQLIHHSLSSHFVRSKSESMIASLLFMNHIPFRYEAALTLGNTTLYPDFTIRHPTTGKFVFWEHFGLMDDALYSQKATSKIQLYSSHGIVLYDGLIITSETKDHPLSIETIKKIISVHFL